MPWPKPTDRRPRWRSWTSARICGNARWFRPAARCGARACGYAPADHSRRRRPDPRRFRPGRARPCVFTHGELLPDHPPRVAAGPLTVVRDEPDARLQAARHILRVIQLGEQAADILMHGVEPGELRQQAGDLLVQLLV